ncbi:MAG: lipoprotein [Pseudomonadota bacterium]|nr:lipoprotein [Pseudomonadota bacterium]
MRRFVTPILAALALAGCAGAYVAGDAGPHHENLGDRGALAAAPPR